MKMDRHPARQYADVIGTLLPEGLAWDWKNPGFGDAMLLGTSEELARLEADAQAVLDAAIELHRPKHASWTLDDYRLAGCGAVGDVKETLPRKPFVAGSHAGERLWSAQAASATFYVRPCEIRTVKPFVAGSHAGDRLWSARNAPFILEVRYYATLVDPLSILAGLRSMAQSHVMCFFNDVTGYGREAFYGPN